MIALSLNNVTLILGARSIFRNLSWSIQHDAKIGLIGPNGAGKSSLFKLIAGEHSAEPGGSVVKAKGIHVGYLPQHPELDPEVTVFATVMATSDRWLVTRQKLEAVEARMGEPAVWGDAPALALAIEEQERLLEAYTALGGDSYPDRVRETLCGLGLCENDFDKPVGRLSGGQKKLVGLASLLLASPPVLLLDEPDNHLDLAGKAFLERAIRAYPGAVVIVSHDRYLLDAVVTHIAEIEDGKLFTYTGDYSSYILDKEERLARQEQLYRVQQREVSRLEMVIKRYSIWAKVYDNEKFAARAQSIQKRLDKMDKIDRPVLERRRMDLELNGWRGSNKVLELAGLEKSYGKQPVLCGVKTLVRHGERVGLIGPNGAGKSVLLRLILGLEEPDAGEVLIGPSVSLGYYAQEHETLDFDSTLLDCVRRAKPMSEAQAVAFLNRYLFPYRMVTQKIGALSGGERSRLQLALLVLSGANFLLLDEPTNNLDISSAEVLEESLSDFVGTVLVISHDRYFLDRTVDRILLLDSGELREYQGNYSDYALKAGVL